MEIGMKLLYQLPIILLRIIVAIVKDVVVVVEEEVVIVIGLDQMKVSVLESLVNVCVIHSYLKCI